jgi:hypothetical protein
MPATAILRGAAAALLLSLSMSPAFADHRAGHGGPFYGAPAARMHAQPRRAGPMRPALHHRHHGSHHGHYRGHGYKHHGFHGARHHAGRAFFHRRHHHAVRHHGPGFHRAYGHFPRKRFFRAHGYGLGGYARPTYGHGYGASYARPVHGASYGSYPPVAYGTVAGAAPYGPLYNRPAGVCY